MPGNIISGSCVKATGELCENMSHLTTCIQAFQESLLQQCSIRCSKKSTKRTTRKEERRDKSQDPNMALGEATESELSDGIGKHSPSNEATELLKQVSIINNSTVNNQSAANTNQDPTPCNNKYWRLYIEIIICIDYGLLLIILDH